MMFVFESTLGFGNFEPKIELNLTMTFVFVINLITAGSPHGRGPQ